MMLDLDRLDSLARSLATEGSRRRLLGVLSAVPVVGGLMPLLAPEETDAKDRRRRRKQRHKKRKDTGKGKGKNKQDCKPKNKAQVCAGTCGAVKSRQTCGKTVDCGSCDCSPACGECFTCQGNAGAPGTCVPQTDTPCGEATCQDGVLQPWGSCDSSGVCQPAEPVSCAPYTQCDGSACATSCADDHDCVAGSFCDGGQCVGDREDGAACAHDGQCASAHCVDDVCCNAACDGACEACNLTGFIGTCTTEANGVTCGGGNICCSGSCLECCDNDECDDPDKPICVSGTCTACTGNGQCGSGQVCCGGSCYTGICCQDTDCDAPGAPDCVGRQCVCPGNSNTPCAAGTACCNDGCFDLETSTAHCGTCGTTCAAGRSCCGGGCVNLQTDVRSCGACGNACQAGEICVGGACQGCNVRCIGSAEECGQALEDAVADESLSTLYVCPGTYRVALQIARGVTIIGAGQDEDPTTNTLLTQAPEGRTLNRHLGSMRLEQLRIDGGCFLRSTDAAVLQDCTLTAGSEGYSAYLQSNGTLEMTRCTVRDTTSSAGGGLLLQRVRATFTDCLIEDNVSTGYGGGVNSLSGELTLAGTTIIRNNTALGAGGGGIYVNGCPLTIGPDCRITGNTAAEGRGGGILRAQTLVTLQGPHPSPIVVKNCHENCAVQEGDPIAGCAPGGFCPE